MTNTNANFLQIHMLTSYASALLNRDDSGLAKRLPFGNAMRTRISSQCLKRHWRVANDIHALHSIDGKGEAFRSREIVTKAVFDGIDMPGDVRAEMEPVFQKAVYGDKGASRDGRPTILLGAPEIEWLREELAKLVAESGGDAKAAKTLADKWVNGVKKGKGAKDVEEIKGFKKNIDEMRKKTELPAGLVGALFGRMVTSDPAANITAPVHVAHAFTVHAEQSESDYFVAVDDLQDLEKGDETGTDTIQETEITSGIFYSYVVVDLKGLASNLGPAAHDLAGKVIHNLVHLVAEVSPGAKLGSTAPYSRAGFMLLEAGSRQPRSLADAFRKACKPDMDEAIARLSAHLARMDAAYDTGEDRRYLSIHDAEVSGAARGSIKDLASWASNLPERS